MNISSINTREDFYKLSEIWYQRAKLLMSISTDNEESLNRRTKALYLWRIMFTRISCLMHILTQINKPRPNVGNYSKYLKEVDNGI